MRVFSMILTRRTTRTHIRRQAYINSKTITTLHHDNYLQQTLFQLFDLFFFLLSPQQKISMHHTYRRKSAQTRNICTHVILLQKKGKVAGLSKSIFWKDSFMMIFFMVYQQKVITMFNCKEKTVNFYLKTFFMGF